MQCVHALPPLLDDELVDIVIILVVSQLPMFSAAAAGINTSFNPHRYTSTNHSHKKIRPENTRKSLGTFDFTTCKRYKKPLTCSMRIEELAVPSKRQCLDTWRENYKILPEVMVRDILVTR